MKFLVIFAAILTLGTFVANAQQGSRPEDTEVWEPVPKIIKPGNGISAPSDAIILFDGKNLDKWQQTDDKSSAKWDVSGGVLTVNKKYGNIETKELFTNYQLHIEWRVPSNITGSGQARGNSGVFLASLGNEDAGYELQVLDPYNRHTLTAWQEVFINKQYR